jgi:hypothetical protein
MKKLILAVCLVITIFAAQAQTKVTKAAITGKWAIAVMNMDGMIYYDIEKDSLALGKKMIEQLASMGQDSSAAVDMMKGQLESVKEVSFEFNENCTYSMEGSTPGGGVETGSYTVDEATETIIATSKKSGEKQEMKASFKDGKLIINMPGGQAGAPSVSMHFKKAKQ